MPKKKKLEQPKIQKSPNTVLELFYSTPIYFKDLTNAKELNQHLLKHIYAWKKRDEKGIIRSNSLGWHSAVDMHHRKEYNPLLKELFKMQLDIFKSEGYHPDTEPFCDNMWANVNYKYSHNKNHTHPGALWSGVYYIKCPPDCGHIWFTDPSGHKTMAQPIMDKREKLPRHSWSTVHYQPVEGRLIMFPGWLAHEVDQNMSNLKGEKGWRVSVSFNFKQRWQQGKFKELDKGGYASKGVVTLDQIK